MLTSNGKLLTSVAHENSREYIQSLLKSKRSEAFKRVENLVNEGIAVETIYLDVLQPAMYEIGRLWQVDEIDIAVEHYCTAATQLLMAHLFPPAISTPRNGKRMLGCCLGSELHELGMRMVSDVFEFSGWDTYFIGALTPGNSLLKMIESQMPDVVCLSATMPYGLSPIKEAIDGIKTCFRSQRPKIIVGGLAFAINPNLAEVVGADSTGADARAALTEAQRLTF